MRKNEIDELINIYESYGTEEVVARLYEIQKQNKTAELSELLSAYMHLTNRNNNSYFYTSDREQVITNNTGSVIYFNKKIFDFKNINDRKIVTKSSLKVNEDEMMEIIGTFRTLCGNKVTPTNNIDFLNGKAIVTTKHNSAEFNQKEFELVAKLLNYPTFNLSDNTSVMYMQGDSGYAYIKGYKAK